MDPKRCCLYLGPGALIILQQKTRRGAKTLVVDKVYHDKVAWFCCAY